MAEMMTFPGSLKHAFSETPLCVLCASVVDRFTTEHREGTKLVNLHSGCSVEDEAAPGKNLFNLSEPCGEQRLFLFLNRHVELRIRHPSITNKVVAHQIETFWLQDAAHL